MRFFLNEIFPFYAKEDTFFLVAGPCVIENETMGMKTAEKLKAVCEKNRIPLIFKSSYKKANRTRLDSFTGIGDLQALKILKKIKRTFDIPVITDIHAVEEAELAAEYVDILQIPAFLSRQTDIIIAAAKTNKVVNVKKGQFLSPDAMKFIVEKIRSVGNNKVMLTERGTMFGYHDLVVDFTGIPTMQANDVPVIVDCTHSLQKPNQKNGVSGGSPQFIETLAKAAVAIGSEGIFIETHPNPS
ncbi:MAG TPA: 3-deoxy-8-phosphooctulonate synthase, partial [Flavipsychrobacter sp.]